MANTTHLPASTSAETCKALAACHTPGNRRLLFTTFYHPWTTTCPPTAICLQCHLVLLFLSCFLQALVVQLKESELEMAARDADESAHALDVLMAENLGLAEEKARLEVMLGCSAIQVVMNLTVLQSSRLAWH